MLPWPCRGHTQARKQASACWDPGWRVRALDRALTRPGSNGRPCLSLELGRADRHLGNRVWLRAEFQA